MFQLLRDRLALCGGRDVVAERDDDDLPHEFTIERGRLCVEFRHAEIRQEIDDPTNQVQLSDIKKNARHRDGDDRPHDQGLEGNLRETPTSTAASASRNKTTSKFRHGSSSDGGCFLRRRSGWSAIIF